MGGARKIPHPPQSSLRPKTEVFAIQARNASSPPDWRRGCKCLILGRLGLGRGPGTSPPHTSLPAASLCHPSMGTLPQALAGTPACPLQSPPRSRGYRGLLYREAIGHVWRCGPEITGSQRWPEGEAPRRGAAQRMRQQRKRGFTDERPPPPTAVDLEASDPSQGAQTATQPHKICTCQSLVSCSLDLNCLFTVFSPAQVGGRPPGFFPVSTVCFMWFHSPLFLFQW